MLKCNRVPMTSYKLDQNLDVNLGSRSEPIDIGRPCNLTISSTYNWANLSNGSSLLTGRKCANFFSLSTITHMASCCLRVLGSPITKSIVILSHLHTRIGRGCIFPAGFWCSAFTCGQVRHLDTKSTISFFIPSTNNAPSEYDTSWCY